ncbi:MAG: cobalamin biosynthesis protein CobW [Hyphomicrobiales bacterium]|nr:MAG: cobalamin biosynthesis protein CobW [Hyphomicrobiales bacterium]
MASGQKIPATIITGFLGAGKTTIIRHLLQNAGGRRIALIINEFGDMGFDADLLAGCNSDACSADDIIELTNGCICCTVADDFLPTMEALLERDELPDHIIIETSGLALPQPLVRAFSWPSVKSRVTVDGVITVVDAAALADGKMVQNEKALQEQRAADEALDHESPIEELFEDQLKCADLVVLSKADIVSAEALRDAKATAQADTRAGVRFIEARHGAISPEILLGLTSGAEDDMDNRKSHHEDHDHEHSHDDFETFVVESVSHANVDAAKVAVLQAMTLHGVLRIKGSVSIEGKSAPLAVQAVGPRVETWFAKPSGGNSKLVVIGAHDFDQTAISLALRGETSLKQTG